MATLFEYFSKDFSNCLRCGCRYNFSVDNIPQTWHVETFVGYELYSKAKFIAYFVPRIDGYKQIHHQLVDNYEQAFKETEGMYHESGYSGDIKVGLGDSSTQSLFSRKIYLYTDNLMPKEEIESLNQIANKKGISLTIRSESYMVEKNKFEKPLAFISHDSRDKAEVAEKVAVGLQRMLCPVWYDEFSLRVGDNLRTSIEKGLKEAKKCILILSPNFLSNSGWTKTEFDSIFTREILEKDSLILPIWHGVDKAAVFDYSPSLANKVGVNWALGEEEVLRRLYRAIAG